MAPKVTGDSGTASTPTARTRVFSSGMPASDDTADYGTAANTAARADVFNPVGTNPPSATADPGSA